MSEFRRKLMNINKKSEILPNTLFYFPLTENGIESITGMAPTLQYGNVSFSDKGALFTANTRDLLSYNFSNYNLKESIKSMRYDFLINSGSNYNGYMYILYALGKGQYEMLYTNMAEIPGCTFFQYTQRNLATFNTSDKYTGKILNYNTPYRVLITRDGQYDNFYLNGQFIKQLLYERNHGYSLGYLTMGNNWRGLYNDGTRAFNGYIKNVYIFDKTFTKEEAINLSKL